MSRLIWDAVGERRYETGVKKGVIYPQGSDGLYPKGAAWNGLTGVTESPSGAEVTPLYANDDKYANLVSKEEFGGTIEAYTFPDEFIPCNGSVEAAPGVKLGQQSRKQFGFTYVSGVSNDTEGYEHGYKVHLVYGALAKPSEVGRSTVNDNPDAITLSWEFSTTPVNVTGFKPVAHLEIDSTKVDAEKLKKLEDILYGKDPTTEGGADGTEARLPLPDEVIGLFKVAAAG